MCTQVLVCPYHLSFVAVGSLADYCLVFFYLCRKLFPVIDLVVLIAINWKEMEYAEMTFDSVIGPTFRNNKETLKKFTD
jgi:hypothetical protein